MRTNFNAFFLTTVDRKAYANTILSRRRNPPAGGREKKTISTAVPVRTAPSGEAAAVARETVPSPGEPTSRHSDSRHVVAEVVAAVPGGRDGTTSSGARYDVRRFES